MVPTCTAGKMTAVTNVFRDSEVRRRSSESAGTGVTPPARRTGGPAKTRGPPLAARQDGAPGKSLEPQPVVVSDHDLAVALTRLGEDLHPCLDPQMGGQAA